MEESICEKMETLAKLMYIMLGGFKKVTITKGDDRMIMEVIQ